jgi:hypothetical protein
MNFQHPQPEPLLSTIQKADEYERITELAQRLEHFRNEQSRRLRLERQQPYPDQGRIAFLRESIDAVTAELRPLRVKQMQRQRSFYATQQDG